MTPPETIDSPATDSLAVRQSLVDALELDLIGPGAGHELAAERLPASDPPSNWYLTGFLIPSGTPPERNPSRDEDDDGDLDEVPDRAGLTEESEEDRRAAKKAFFPSSMGLSFLAFETPLEVIVRWGDYVRLGGDGAEGENPRAWQRTPREETVSFNVASGADTRILDVPRSGGLQLHVERRLVTNLRGIPPGSFAVSVFLVNNRQVVDSFDEAETTYAFQAELEVRGDRTFLRRPDPREAQRGEWEEQVADLHYADAPRYATGHNVSADWELEADGACRVVRTNWIPRAEVEKTETFEPPGVDLSMDRLGALNGAAEVEQALTPLLHAYHQWIENRREELQAADEAAEPDSARRDTTEELLRRAAHAATRIEKGIATLAEDEEALDAFRVANRAVASALRRRLPHLAEGSGPKWRAFQLAFILLNLPGLADPKDPNRETVDLLFFPTGGGKTEAYLGLAAFAIVLRRLRNSTDGGRAGAGVSVIMRYTLRLLTLDQLARAARLVCGLELEREASPERYGQWPFEIGLWVGKAATPNHMGRKGNDPPGSARSKVRRHRREPSANPSPIPLENCPWCGEKFTPDSFSLQPNDDEPRNLRVVCSDFECEFSGNRPLPIVAVDEPLYRRLPCFLIATVDKFASLPWEGRSGALLGGADRHDAEGFYGAAEPGPGRPLSSSLLPPDLIIQDELHLIAGPLGSMTGLYETAIEALSNLSAKGPKPKIVASTATTRESGSQIRALFGRQLTHLFPPPGPARRDSFFAQVVRANQKAARLYLGIAAPGRNAKVVMRRVLLPLMAAAQHRYREAGGRGNQANPADPYMTVLAYFNSLRELGGARRIIEEEVQNTLHGYGLRSRPGQQRRYFRDRRTYLEPLELTSRVSTADVADARRRLGLPFHDNERVDCALATNMISVGLDIQRLGLMVVLGQPKTNAEYIQATSRVGRADERPGLVITLLNVHKPRDRSHYERFRHYHETFYRSVEAGSVTPFAPRALDRGLAGALVTLARHAEPALTPALGVARINETRVRLKRLLIESFSERIRSQPGPPDEVEERLRSVQDRIADLLDSWEKVVSDYEEVGARVKYQQYEQVTDAKPLLREMLDTQFESAHHKKFRVNRSLRDVEPQVNLFVVESTHRNGPG
jgi:hypothetical protein